MPPLDLGLATISRWLHVTAAVIGIGGTAFVYFVLLPAVSASGASAELLDRVRRRFKRLSHLAIGVLLLTGFYNYLVVAAPRVGEWPVSAQRSAYHALMGSKILLAILLFLIAILYLKPLPVMQQNRRLWLGINLVLGAAILFIGAVLRRMW